MSVAEMIGAAGGVVTTGSFVPQAWRTWRRRSAEDLSWAWLGAFLAGVVLWGTNGLLTANRPLLVANIIMGSLVATIAVLKAMSPARELHGAVVETEAEDTARAVEDFARQEGMTHGEAVRVLVQAGLVAQRGEPR